MKKILMGFAVCALIMTGCQKNDVIENITDSQGQLTFAAGTTQQGTKAAELNNTTLQSNDITLYAYQSVSGTWGKWYNDVVKYSGGKWALKNSVRFRNVNATKYITFSPRNESPGLGATEVGTTFAAPDFINNFPKIQYQASTTNSEQVDLVAGITGVDASKTDITLGMRHILSQVNFGTVGYTGAKIQIQNIQIQGVQYSGEFTYNAENTYPIGKWSNLTSTATYKYYNYTNSVDNVTHTLVPATATSGDKYIFGDGGNAGPGLNNVLYPDPKDGGKWKTLTARSTGLDNSLMLLPQTLTDGAKVTFQYKIQDVDNGYVAGSPNDTDWAEGEFKLNFSTGTNGANEAKYYDSKWEQNYRYVYLIDFTDFLNGVALTFKVDVETYSWENYNNGTNDDGIVNIMAAGQPSQANMNATTFVNGDTWYIASQSETDPTKFDPKKWAQVMRNETWDLSAYDFANINAGDSIIFNFRNVIFNTNGTTPVADTITLALPDGYTVAKGTGIAMIGTGPYKLFSGDTTANAKITIKNTLFHNKATSLKDSITAITTTGKTIYYKGTAAVNLTTMDNTSLTTAGSTVVVKFTSSVISTVGATTNGLWTWNTTTQTATWKKVTWKALSATETAFSSAASGEIIYSSDATADLSAKFATEPTALAKDAVVTIVFNNAASRIMPVATYGTWSYYTNSNTAIYKRNDLLTLTNAETAFKDVTTDGSTIKCGDATVIEMGTEFGQPTDVTNVTSVTVVFSKSAARTFATATTDGTWANPSGDNKTYVWTKN